MDSKEENLPQQGLIFDVSLKGHRQSYFEVFRLELGFGTIWGPISKNLRALMKTPRLFCLTIDDYLVWFFCIAMLRSFSGKPTLGLSLRIENIFQRLTFKRWGKRLVYRILLNASGVSTFSLKPFYLEPRLSEVAKDWLYDPQWWDLSVNPIPIHTPPLEIQLQFENALGAGKPVVVLPGHQSLIKGLEIFTKFAQKNRQFMCVCIGPNSDIPETSWQAFREAGGLVILTDLSEGELAWLYEKADVIWACYRPDYDQSSGIFGRALQRKKRVAVREQSFLHHFAVATQLQNVISISEDGAMIPRDSGTPYGKQSFSPLLAREFSISQVKKHLHRRPAP